MTTQDPFTRGSAVTILPGVPLDGVPAQRSESSPSPEDQAPASPAPAAAPAIPAPAGPPATLAPPAAPPAALFPPAAAVPNALPVPTAPMPPVGAPVPPPVSALPPAGPAYVPQSQAFPTAPVFDADIPAAPAAYPFDVPAAGPASPFTQAPAPAFPPADAVTAPPAPALGAPFQPAAAPSELFPPAAALPPLDVTPDDKQSKTGKRRKEGGSSVSPIKVAAVGAAVIGLAAGWFGHGALSGSSSSSTATPVITHVPVKRAVPLQSVSAIGTVHVLPKPWVTTGQQALLSSSVVSSSTPVYFGSGGVHGTFAEMGVSVGTLSTVAASRGTAFPAGPGGGAVRCGVTATNGLPTSWCTWKDGKSSGMVARFATSTITDAYRWTQLVRQTLEP